MSYTLKTSHFYKNMEFFRTIRKSIYDREFYTALKTSTFVSAFKYYSFLILSVSLIISLSLGAFLFLFLSHDEKIENIRTDILALYPDELTLHFQDGKMTSNVSEPYAIPVPSSWNLQYPKNILVIKTKDTIVKEDFQRYETNILLGNDSLWIYDSGKKSIEIKKVDGFIKEDTLITRDVVTKIIDTVFSIGKKVFVILLFFLPFFIFVYYFSFYLFYLIFGAVIIFLIAKIFDQSITYGQAYKIGLHLITVPVLYDLLSVASLSIIHIPFGFTLILIVMTYLNFVSNTSVIKTESIDDIIQDTQIISNDKK